MNTQTKQKTKQGTIKTPAREIMNKYKQQIVSMLKCESFITCGNDVAVLFSALEMMQASSEIEVKPKKKKKFTIKKSAEDKEKENQALLRLMRIEKVRLIKEKLLELSNEYIRIMYSGPGNIDAIKKTINSHIDNGIISLENGCAVSKKALECIKSKLSN